MIRIALISDIHFGKYSRTSEFSVPGVPIKDETKGGESLKDGIISILKSKEVQYLFIAGDLTSVGSPQEFYYCEKILIDITNQLGISRNNIICSLGNHDVDRAISALSDSEIYQNIPEQVHQKAKEKYQLMAASNALYCFDSIIAPPITGQVPFSGVIETEEFIVFILNSSWQCSQYQEIPHGKLSEKQLEWLDNICEDYLGNNKTKIILMHHHAISYQYPTGGHDTSMIEESSQLVDIAGSKGIQLIMHGHRHHPMATTYFKEGWKNPISFICAGSLSVNPQYRNNGEIPNTMHIIELGETTDSIKLYNYEFSSTQGWMPFKTFRPETPIDSEMFLGKLYNDIDNNEAILKYLTYEGEVTWDSLDECLKYINFEKLNLKFRELLSDTHKIFDKFPSTVMLIKKEVALNE